MRLSKFNLVLGATEAGCNGCILELGWLYITMGLRIRVLVGKVRVILPSRVISIRIWIVLWCSIETMQVVSVLNGRRTFVALNRCVPLHTTGLRYSIYSKRRTRIAVWSG